MGVKLTEQLKEYLKKIKKNKINLLLLTTRLSDQIPDHNYEEML